MHRLVGVLLPLAVRVVQLADDDIVGDRVPRYHQHHFSCALITGINRGLNAFRLNVIAVVPSDKRESRRKSPAANDQHQGVVADKIPNHARRVREVQMSRLGIDALKGVRYERKSGCARHRRGLNFGYVHIPFAFDDGVLAVFNRQDKKAVVAKHMRAVFATILFAQNVRFFFAGRDESPTSGFDLPACQAIRRLREIVRENFIILADFTP